MRMMENNDAGAQERRRALEYGDAIDSVVSFFGTGAICNLFWGDWEKKPGEGPW